MMIINVNSMSVGITGFHSLLILNSIAKRKFPIPVFEEFVKNSPENVQDMG